MATGLFSAVGPGIELISDDLTEVANILQSDQFPGSTSWSNNAPIGSLYLKTSANVDENQIYWKYRNTQNSIDDWKTVGSVDYINEVISGISWREPVIVNDDTLYANAAAFPTTGTINGVVIPDGGRVLFSNVTNSTDENVFIWDATGTTWTEASNAESDGDAVLVQDGTHAEEQWTYNGTDWVLFGSVAGNVELQYIRDFCGKTGPGVENPSYSSTNIVTQSGSLQAAIGELDAAFGDNGSYTEQNFVTNGEALTTSIDKLDIQMGNNVFTQSNIVSAVNDITENFDAIDVAIGDRAYTDNNWVTDGETVTASLNALDGHLGNSVFTEQNVVTNGESVTSSLDALDQQSGNGTYTEQNVVSNANNHTENIDALDQAVGDIVNQGNTFHYTNITTQTVVDSIPVGEAEVAKWIVGAEKVSDASNRNAYEVHAVHDGSVSDETKYAVVKRGGHIDGLKIDTDVSAGNFRLLVRSPSNAVDVVVRRIAYFTIN